MIHIDKEIACLQCFTPNDGQPYWGCFSGGKDSVVIKELARLAGVPIEWHYNITTIDPPELVHFIRDVHPDVRRDGPKNGNFFTRMLVNGFPTRTVRWCCKEYKEATIPEGRRMVMGIRAAESPRRRTAWKQVTRHRGTGDWVINPIIGWTTEDVWNFIRERGLPYCKLYDEPGVTRLGCIGCPMGMSKGKQRQFARWPRYERAWREAFRKLWERRTRGGKSCAMSLRFSSWEEVWEWWLSDAPWPGTGEKTDDGECDGMPLD